MIPGNDMGDSLTTGLLDLLFLQIALGGVGDSSGLQPSATAGSFYVSLHVGAPGRAGTQLTNETTVGGYARLPVSRTGSGWARVANSISNVAIMTFGQCTSGSQTVTHFVIGTESTGAGKLLVSAPLIASLLIVPPITPQFAAGSLIFVFEQ